MTHPAHVLKLLQELADGAGAARLDFDADGILPLCLPGVDFALVYDVARESYFFMAPFEKAASAAPTAIEGLELGEPRAQWLRGFVPETNSRLLLREHPAKGLSCEEFYALAEEFAETVRQERIRVEEGEPNLPSEAFALIRP